MTVSIIIAVYNAEKYLQRCLESVLGQTYRDIEVIAVDDCSTDGSLQVLQRYAERDSRMKVLRMERNSGAPAARNKAMTVSRGELMSTVDADDAISPDAIEKAVRIFEANPTVDIVTYDLVRVSTVTNEEIPKHKNPRIPRRMSGKEACYWTILWDIPGLDVVRTSLEKRFFAETQYGQYGDETTTHIVFYHAREVVLGEGKYYYYQNPESYTNAISIKRFELLECRQSLRRQLVELGADERIIRRLDRKRWGELMSMCNLYRRYRDCFTPEEQKALWGRMSETYDTFRFRDLPLSLSLMPFRAMMPSFSLFYRQQMLKLTIKDYVLRFCNSLHI
jgi:glycosyltransferase involved in cell wall biosynthesis